MTGQILRSTCYVVRHFVVQIISKSGDEFGLVTEDIFVFHLNLLSHVIADQPLEFRCKLGVEVSLDQICHSYS